MNLEKVLPPGVSGKISGHLTVKVEEVFWNKSSPGEIFVELLWWGEKDSTIFRPEDITLNENPKKLDNSVIYNIRTSPGLFEAYLRNCGKLTFKVLRGQNKNVIVGSTVIKDIHQIMTEKSIHSYYAIYSPKGLRIGDLFICLDLTFNVKQSDKDGNVRDSKRKHLPSKSSTATTQEDLALSDILRKGNELRKAMTMSVLADCPVDKIDEVLNDKLDKKVEPRKINAIKDPQLVDFLLGKDMTAEEEKKALETLRCVSPDENLINLAKPIEQLEPCKVSKTSCCLHGKKCTSKKTLRKSHSAPVSSTSVPSSSCSTNNPSQDTKVDKTEDKSSERNFNCYRLMVKSLDLTVEGTRKIYCAPVLPAIDDPLKPKHVHYPPGTSFTLEITLPSKGPWSRTLKFSTKDYKEKRIYFGHGTTHRLCGTVSWPRVKTQVLGSTFKVYWRHLNQRVNCPLGSTKLEAINPQPDSDSVSLSLPLYTNTRLLTGHLNICLSLGVMTREGGEAMFRTEEKAPQREESDLLPASSTDAAEFDGVTSEFSSKPAIISIPSKDSIPSDSSDEEVPTQNPSRRLDDELVRTIDLLNSKPGSAAKSSRSQTKEPSHKVERITKQEACVQTTLPLTNPECASCHHCDRNSQRDRRYPVSESATQVTLTDWKSSSPPERLNCRTEYYTRSCAPPPPEPSLSSGLRSHPMYNDYCHPHENLYPDKTLKERLRVAPKVLCGSDKIHEYTVTIEKVVGVPLFTGDNDLDCYIDYSFPKVDENGIMTFDKVNMGSVRIALRETEFGTISKHRLRLGCKLSRALLTLPSHEIIFNLWGRFYRPSRQDYRLGKATLPLSKLSSLEMKYEQQCQRQPIIEKFIIPLEALESSVTAGYKGPFGEIHISIGYSNASGMSYREWRCKDKDDHYWCQDHLCNVSTRHPHTEPNYECVKAQTNHPYPHEHVDSFRPFQNLNEPFHKADLNEQQYSGLRSGLLASRPLKDYNRNDRYYPFEKGFETASSGYPDVRRMPSSFERDKYLHRDFRQTNLREYMTDSQYVSGFPKGVQNENFPIRNNGIENTAYGMHQRMQPIGESIVNSCRTNTNTDVINGETIERMLEPDGKRENIVKKVLKDIQERRRQEKLLASSKNKDKSVTAEKNDAFNSFDLKVDLPKEDDSSEFEVRSQYSFLKTPEPSFPANNNANFESVASDSVNRRLFEDNNADLFSSHSNFSVVSNSLFEPAEKDIVKSNFSNRNNGNGINNTINAMNSKISARKNILHNNKIEYENIEPEKENSISSNETLKSVESLKSFKEPDPIPSSSMKDTVIHKNSASEDIPKQTLTKSCKFFKARVEICRALGLPSLEVKQSDGKIGLVKPTSHAYFSAFLKGKECNLQTPVVEKKSDPVWDSSWDVELPVDLLKKSDRELEIFVDLSGDSEEPPLRMSDVSMHWPIVLRTGVDLTPITAGLEHASGWYSLSDRALLSRAQIKVIVTPLEDVSRYRVEWLKEYTKSKGRKMDMPQPEQSSLAAALQEKLLELERLTQCMKNKMTARSQWDESPPLSLLSEANKQSLGPFSDIVSYIESRKKQGSPTDHLTKGPIDKSVVVISDDSGDDSEDRGSYEVVNTYTVSEGSAHNRKSENDDSLETSSQAIDRIITKVRENR